MTMIVWYLLNFTRASTIKKKASTDEYVIIIYFLILVASNKE